MIIKGKLQMFTSERAILRHPKNDGDVFVYKQHINRAFPEDFVAVYVFPVKHWRVIEPDHTFRLTLNTVVKSMSNLPNLTKLKDYELNSNQDPPWLKPFQEGFANTSFGVSLQRTGCVVSILSPSYRTVHGRLIDKDEKDMYLFMPQQKNYPPANIYKKDLSLEKMKDLEQLAEANCLATYFKWEPEDERPTARLHSLSSDSYDLEFATNTLLQTHNLCHGPFPDNVLNEANHLIQEASEKTSFLPREDFTHRCVMSIDPSTAKDLDDAIHVRSLINNTVEVGVHIADVAHYLKEGSDTDIEAARRATSVYLVHQTYPMLPPIFSENLCSLNPGEKKLTFSVIFQMDMDGNIISHHFTRSQIRSCAKLSYEEAQLLMNNFTSSSRKKAAQSKTIESIREKILKPFTLEQVQHDLNILLKITRKLRQKRLGKGALILQQSKIKFILNVESRKHLLPDPNSPSPVVNDNPAPTKSSSPHLLGSVLTKIKSWWNKPLGNSIDKKEFSNTTDLKPPDSSAGVNDSIWPVGWSTYELNESNHLIEELMLLANQAVAKFLFENWQAEIHSSNPMWDSSKHFDALLRRHENPMESSLKCLAARCEEAKLVNSGKNFELSEVLKTASKLEEEKPQILRGFYDAFSVMCVMQMKSAEYFSTDYTYSTLFDAAKKTYNKETKITQRNEAMQQLRTYSFHYGLGVPLYTHFTSPIRRYADVIVHRQLEAFLVKRETAKHTRVAKQFKEIMKGRSLMPEFVQEQALLCHTKHVLHKRLGDRCQELFLAAFMRHSGPLLERGYIIALCSHTATINFPRCGIVLKVVLDKVFDSEGRSPYFIRNLSKSKTKLTIKQRQLYSCDSLELLWPALDEGMLDYNNTLAESNKTDQLSEVTSTQNESVDENDSQINNIFPPLCAPSFQCRCLYQRMSHRVSLLDSIWCQLSCQPTELSIRAVPCRPRCGKCRHETSVEHSEPITRKVVGST